MIIINHCRHCTRTCSRNAISTSNWLVYYPAHMMGPTATSFDCPFDADDYQPLYSLPRKNEKEEVKEKPYTKFLSNKINNRKKKK